MADDYYPQATPSESESGAGGGDDESQEKAGSDSALLPKALFEGKDIKPGTTVSFKIVADHGDEVEVTCCDEDDNENKPTDSPEMGSAMDQLGAMGGAEQ